MIKKALAGGISRESSIEYYRLVPEMAGEEDARGTIPGCTGIPLPVDRDYVSVPFINTTEIHSRAAVDYAPDGR